MCYWFLCVQNLPWLFSPISQLTLSTPCRLEALAQAATSWLLPAFLKHLLEDSHQPSPDVAGLMAEMTLWKQAWCHPGSFPSAANRVLGIIFWCPWTEMVSNELCDQGWGINREIKNQWARDNTLEWALLN